MEISRLGFLEIYKTDDSIMGVIMVTDTETKPIEFRVTSPIKPTSFQKILYGNVLEEHISVELVALPLLNAINEELDLILVNDANFLGINSKQETRAVRIFSGSKAATNNLSQLQLKPSNGRPDPVLLETSKEMEDELPGIIEALTPLSLRRDLIEPFDRLKLACEQVHNKRTKE